MYFRYLSISHSGVSPLGNYRNAINAHTGLSPVAGSELSDFRRSEQVITLHEPSAAIITYLSLTLGEAARAGRGGERF
jgi:hypothetical protein